MSAHEIEDTGLEDTGLESTGLEIAPAPLSSPAAQALIRDLDAELTARYPRPEDNHLDLPAAHVAADQGVFVIARVNGVPAGCGALRRIAPGLGEIKRMYVAPSHRGRRLGARILAELEGHARWLGLHRLVLETGERQPEAIGLYARNGFARIDRFGEYVNSPASVCMGKTIQLS